MKSLQLRGCRQIAEPHKYCLVHVIVFFGVYFLYFFFFVSHRLGIRVNSLQLVSEPRVRFEWYQAEEAGKASGIENFDGTNFAYLRM